MNVKAYQSAQNKQGPQTETLGSISQYSLYVEF